MHFLVKNMCSGNLDIITKNIDHYKITLKEVVCFRRSEETCQGRFSKLRSLNSSDANNL